MKDTELNETLSQLVVWLGACSQLQAINEIRIQSLSGDAGHRQYFHIDAAPEYLAVYAPPKLIDSQIFVDLVHYLREQGIHAPQVFAFDKAKGFLLIENFGDELYLSALNADNVEALYGEALLTLLRMQQSPSDENLINDYDAEKLHAEMALFPEWFVEKLLGYPLSAEEKNLIDNTFASLSDSALQQPQVFVHRDYHSRNLVHRPVGPPGVIDFQDGVWGPITYDLVSLLKDCYVRWPQERVSRWAQAYRSMIVSAGLIKQVDPDIFQRWFDLMGLQRHIKVLGIFARLSLRDNKNTYLHDLPLVIRYTLDVVGGYPEFARFHQWFAEKLLPLCEQQSWYTDFRNAGYCPADGAS